MNSSEGLYKEKVSHLDLSGFCRLTATLSVREALTQMRREQQNVGLVFDGPRLAGIVTDRDILRKVVTAPEQWDEPVTAVMTPDPCTIPPDSTAVAALWLMDEKGFRNLPVVDNDGNVVGTMTHQAIINYLAARYPVEILNLPPRPHQYPSRSEGGD